MECFGEILDIVRRKTPVVHSITNYVTVNDCANMILAAGGSPIMADDAAEVEQIVALSSALVLNIGTLNARTVEAMLAAHPVQHCCVLIKGSNSMKLSELPACL